MSIESNKIILFGTGEYGELAYYYLKHDSNYEVVAFTSDNEYVEKDIFNGLPHIPISEITNRYPPNEYSAHVALSYKKLNQNKSDKYYHMKKLGYRLINYISTKSVVWPDLEIGDNCFILENQTIQPKVKIGNNVMI